MATPEVDTTGPDLEDLGVRMAFLSPLSLLLEMEMGMFPSLLRSSWGNGVHWVRGNPIEGLRIRKRI